MPIPGIQQSILCSGADRKCFDCPGRAIFAAAATATATAFRCCNAEAAINNTHRNEHLGPIRLLMGSTQTSLWFLWAMKYAPPQARKGVKAALDSGFLRPRLVGPAGRGSLTVGEWPLSSPVQDLRFTVATGRRGSEGRRSDAGITVISR